MRYSGSDFPNAKLARMSVVANIIMVVASEMDMIGWSDFVWFLDLGFAPPKLASTWNVSER